MSVKSSNSIRLTRPQPGPGVYDGRATMQAWENFLLRGKAPRSRTCNVRLLIQESWSRSASSGINAERSEAPLNVDMERIALLRHGNRDLLTAARGSFAQLGRLLDDTGAMLILTDNKGVIIDTIGDAKTLEQGRKIHLEVGGAWNESAVGTNGIGTALWTGEPVFVHAAEHFCLGIKGWTCAAAPICDPLDQSVVGVIDLSGPTDIFQRHNIALVAAAAREIQEALEERQKEERAQLLEAYIDSATVTGASDGVVILDRFGRVIYSRNTSDWSVLAEAGTDIAIGRRLVELSENTSDAEIAAALPSGLCPSDINPLRLNGEFRGAALVLANQRSATPARRSSAESLSAPQGIVKSGSMVVISECTQVLEAIELSRRVAKTGTSVLIQGETGVGKELFARLVHSEADPSASNPFVAVNCGAVTKELFGGELFGHVAGAFTGAVREGKPGKFELADGGVLCLDEIGEMPLDIQPYLLRVLEERAVYRIGDSKSRPVDVHLVSLTNRDLKSEVEAGRFRRDLYYRIGTVTIHVPPLRARGHDVRLLTEHFSRRIGAETGHAPLRFSDAAMDMLLAYDWPGNVRELRNVIERLNLLVRGRNILPGDLPMEISDSALSADGGSHSASRAHADIPATSLEAVERQTIKRAILAEKGNMTRVARVLGISRPTLYRKMKQYEIHRIVEWAETGPRQ